MLDLEVDSLELSVVVVSEEEDWSNFSLIIADCRAFLSQRIHFDFSF